MSGCVCVCVCIFHFHILFFFFFPFTIHFSTWHTRVSRDQRRASCVRTQTCARVYLYSFGMGRRNNFLRRRGKFYRTSFLCVCVCVCVFFFMANTISLDQQKFFFPRCRMFVSLSGWKKGTIFQNALCSRFFDELPSSGKSLPLRLYTWRAASFWSLLL